MVNKNLENTYDYFKNDPIVLNGRFARYANAMWTQNKIDENSRFVKLLDMYAIAAIVGLRIGKRLSDDRTSEDKRTIQLDQIAKQYKRFLTIMQVILLIDDSRHLNPEEKVEIAFDTNPKSEEIYRKNMDLFHSYARGGLEYLYNKLVIRPVDIDDDFSNARIANLMAFVKEPINKDEIF